MYIYASRPLNNAARSSRALRYVLLPSCSQCPQRHGQHRAVSASTSTLTPLDGKHRAEGSQVPPRDTEETKGVLRGVREALASASRLRVQVDSEVESVLGPLTSVCDAFISAEPRTKVIISVYSEEDASARNVVSALLDDPLSSDSTLRSVINNRWNTGDIPKGSLLSFEQTGVEATEENSITLSSSFFSRFSHPTTLQELRTSESSSEAIEHLLKADIPVLVISPIHLPSPLFSLVLSQNPHALLVVDSALNHDSPSAKDLRSQIAGKYGCDPSRIFLLDAARALRGAASFMKDPSSASAVRAYQEDFPASGIPTLLRAMTDIVSLGPVRLQVEAEGALTKRVLSAGKAIVKQAANETRSVRSRASALQEYVLEDRERSATEILGGDAGLAVRGEQGRVALGVERAAAEVRPVLDGLTWYRLPFVVDEVSTRVDSAVERAFAREFENELIFHTGRLSSLQSKLVSRTMTLLASLPPGFQSPVLQNTLAQLTTSPSFLITPSSPSSHTSSSTPVPSPALLSPVRTRTAQLTHATRALHLSAQRLLLLTFSTTSVSAICSAALCVSSTLDAASAVGASALGALAGLRWAVGKWARVRAKWWGAFDRVGDGLARDLDGALEGVLDKQVCVVPEEAFRGLQRLVEKRESEIEVVEDELSRLEAKLEKASDFLDKKLVEGQK